MLPRKLRVSVALGLLALCLSCSYVSAEQHMPANDIWNEGPINCYTCDSAEECAQSQGLLRKCEGVEAQTCLIVFDEEGKVMQRGCSAKVTASSSTYCQGNAVKCPSCSSSGCNTATTLDDYNECLACNSLLDKNCVFHPEAITSTQLCYGECMTALYSSAENSNNYHIVRSCLNDRDLDEREACLDGSDAKCIGCIGEHCNKHVLPETRYKCNHCDGEDCDDPQEAECAVFNEREQCYTQFDEKDKDIIGMGCISDFSSEQKVEELLKAKALLVCESELCNSFENIPANYDCTQCNSANDESCATKPSTVNAQKTCKVVPYTNCYQRVKNGATERGCLNDLPSEEFYDCLTGTDDKCKICNGNACNEEIIPANRKTCQRCSSESDFSCHRTPQANSICPIYDEKDACVSSYEKGVTKRGCLSELACNTDSANCEVCEGDGCNTLNIKKRVEEIYGAFEDLPLSCRICKDDSCASPSTISAVCAGEINQDCMTVFDESGKVVLRECEDFAEAEYGDHCEAHPELCFKCKSHDCNTISDAKDYQECLYCNAATDPDCLFKPESITTRRKCVEGCLSALYVRKSNPEVFDFLRACVEDINVRERDICTPENNCVKCTDSNDCNKDILPVEGRLSCLHCNGPDCSKPVTQKCLAYTANEQCYTHFDEVTNVVIKMGCKSDLADAEVAADIKQYYLCNADDCNSEANLPTAKKCYSCNSATDINCAVDPTKITQQDTCETLPYTGCMMRIKQDGTTERGCVHSLPNADFLDCLSGDNELCKTCDADNCNQAVHPANRPVCHRCNSEDDASCADSPASSQVCPLYEATSSCVTKLNSGVTQRGCGSELNCDGANDKTCRTCSGNNCNTDVFGDESIGDPGIFQQLPLNCYQCEGKEACADNGLIKKCEGNTRQTCTTAFNSAGDVIARGCSDELESQCVANECYDCKSNGCNEAQAVSDYVECIFCDASQDIRCLTEVDAITRTRTCHKACMTAVYPRTDDPQPAYELIRTCLDDKDLDDRESCEAGNDKNLCTTCTTEKCNKDVVKFKSCYQCTGDDCQDPQPATCRATMEHDGCFVEYDETNSLIEMGCKSKYDPKELQVLINSKRLLLCDDDNCNSFENLPSAQRCAICNSLVDRDCAVAPTNSIATTSCAKLPFTECYTRILESGHTERGCLSNLEGDDFLNCLTGVNATKCTACVDDNCNTKLHPADRIKCHVCNSDTTAACEYAPKSEQVCLKYTQGETCVALLDVNGATVRGCSSQISCDPKDSSKCQICDGDNCNTSNLKRKADGKPGIWQPLPLTCRACSNVDECATGSRESICFGTDYCMTVFTEEGDVRARSCSAAVESEFGEYCDEHPELCYNCNSNQCNTASKMSDYVECVYCNSDDDINCVANPAAIANKRKCNGQCMTALQPRPDDPTVYNLIRSCLDDKDVADQQICKDGDKLCAACSGAGCNIATLPADRRSCYTCQGENCDDPEAKQCAVYKEDDECFMLFDSQSDIVQMGCISELEDAFVESNRHLMYVCAENNNCNAFENIPKTYMCAECNSNENPFCATEPQNVPTVKQCNALPNTQCYTNINNDGSTRRGCVSSLTKTQMLNCLSGSASGCTTCIGDRCNIDVYPSERRRCHRCNSKEDPSCDSSPQASEVCPFYAESEHCAVKLVNGYTYRGCSSDFQCDESDRQYCRMCREGDNCNVADLASAAIGNPGHWQGLPINCFTCVGEQCQNGEEGTLRKCEGNNLQNCGTVFSASGQVEQRGCSDQIYSGDFASYCDANPNSCKFCKSNACNTATKLADYVDCIFCDAGENLDCLFNVDSITRTRTCHKQCMTGLYPRKDETNPAYELARGCLDDLDPDDREACAAGNNPNCKACSGASCNKDTLPETRQSCYVCDNSDDCADPSTQECTAYRENEQCFTLFDGANDVQSMGCASDMDNAELVANRRHLLLCEGENCNSFDNLPAKTACRVCNSTTDASCATSTTAALATVCDNYPHTQCYMHVGADGSTARGCLSGASDAVYDHCQADDGSTCEICTTNNCNSMIYPANRRSCHRCNSATDPLCEESPEHFASICPVYKASDSCVTKADGDYLMRGCLSDFSCDPAETGTCRICESDNCNSVNLQAGNIGEPGKWQDLPLNCYVCEAADCASGSETVHKCEGNNKQVCMTVFGAENTVISRGCSDSVKASHGDYCDENTGKCFACKSSGCNSATDVSDFVDCYFCDSATSQTCSINFNEATKTRKCQGSCMVALYPRSSSADPAYEMSRSCLNDMDLDEQEACANGEIEYCKACEGARCNDMDLPEVRHECYKCLDDDCQDVKTQECSAHHANDECYILFDQENSIAGMGCRSEYEIEAVTELIKQKRLILCNGKNCNGPETTPTSKMCSVCDSTKDPRCATNPNLVANAERCATLPYTDCYTRVDQSGHTQRGCLSSLPNDVFYGCLMGTDGLCEKCTGDKCNEIDVFPADRWKCHQCSSETDPLCSTAPNSNKACPIYSVTDSCISNIRDGITTRGCASSLKCNDPTDKRSCRVCNTPGCNTANLEKVGTQGEPGRWQDVPINCYTCKGEENCNSGGLIQSCLNNPFQNCMTVFDENGKVIQRGCSDTVEADNAAHCSDNPDKCLGCNSNGCNEATSLEDYVECLWCDAENDADCIANAGSTTKTRMCHKHCMTALYPREEETNPAYGLSRSCYDDMDLDEREECEAGDMEHCQLCSTAKCNTVAMPEKRLSCYVCEGDDCQDPQPTTCAFYRPDDKCYVRYSEAREIESMGCRSEFSNADADNLLKQQRLFLCEDDNCNTFDNLPTAQPCYVCNSRTDVNCATSPDKVTSATNCAALPITQCYTRVLAGATERGCLSNLYDDEFLGCYNGTSFTCEACTGQGCNNKLYPAERTSCHICDSATDPSCEAKPDSVGICPKYDAEDTCLTTLRNGVTYRGCSSSIECDDSSKKSCVKCSGNGCNTVNLAVQNDDNYGKWQDLPLTCLSCTAEECASAETTESLTCENNNEQDCMTVFDAANKVISRGCSDVVEATQEDYCYENPEYCFNCKSNECNSATARSEFVDCIYCDSHKDASCLVEPQSDKHKTRKCQAGCMTALYPSDGSSTPAYDLIRTCLNDKESADQTKCSGDKDATCKACTGANCNVDILPADRQSCYSCIGENCDEPVAKACPLYKADDQCFIWFDDTNSITEMGCVSSFRNQELEALIKTKRIHVCEDENCNSLDKLPMPQKCAVCNSNENPFCATNANEIGNFEMCNMMPYTNCYSKLASDGSTVRGCLSELPGDDFAACLLGTSKDCATCLGDGCNREVFPPDRNQCYSCSSNDDDSCESEPTRKQPCPTVSATETCVTALSNNVTYRGCSSELHCDSTDSSTCRFCTKTGCNAIDLRNKVDDGYHGAWQPLPLKCHTCEGEHCLNSLGPAQECTNNPAQDCMTIFTADGQVMQRGCADAVEDYEDLYCRKNPHLCFKCKSNECNAAWALSEYIECAYCNSATDPMCTINPANSGFATRACFKECMVALLDTEVIRSCLDDKELFVQHECRATPQGNVCASCEGNNCNKFVFPEDRLRCHVCTGASCSSSNAQYCLKYDENDACFAKYENDKVDLMGCVSGQNSSDIEDWTNQNKLYTCKDNDCNDLAKLPGPPEPEVCIACDSSKTPNCAQNPGQVTTTINCTPAGNGCITRVNAAGHTLRGCMNEVTGTECTGAGMCTICHGDKCNNEIYPTNRRKCHICNSAASQNCRAEPNDLQVCLKYERDDKCVSKKTDNFVERGCHSNLTCEDKEDCEICEGDGCNTKDLSGAASLMSNSLVLTLIIAFAFSLGLRRE